MSKDQSLGIIACGIGINYVLENISENREFYSLLKISQYPIPRKKIKEIYDHCDEILLVEEGFPMVEELLKDFFDRDKKVKGKLSGDLPPVGELNPNVVATAIGIYQERVPEVPEIVMSRPPQLCEGCGHSDLFKVIDELTPELGKKKVFGDIGCYALGAITPDHTVNTLIDMGASITMAKGAADAGVENAIAVIGDSTFAHSGMTGLLEAVIEKSPITVIISDNSAVAMTGAQESLAVGRLKSICEGIGVEPDHLKTIVPLKKNHAANVKILREEIAYKGVSVIISQRPCIRLSKDLKDKIKNKIASLN
jgi:indolepyruvate ferredoxin oxidoreductase alpha subunit